MFGLSMPELILILIIALVLFGPSRLPEMGASIGKAIREFKKASDEMMAVPEEKPKVLATQNPEPIEKKPEVIVDAQVVTPPQTAEKKPEVK